MLVSNPDDISIPNSILIHYCIATVIVLSC